VRYEILDISAMLQLIKKFIPKPLFGLYHLTLAWLGNVLYSAPSKKLYLIGVTGTKGKTTTSYFIYQLLEKNGFISALTSTTFFILDGKTEINKTKTGMPGRFFLQKILKKAFDKGAEYAVVETTSEGIAQHRQRYLDYNIAVFTSLSPEHIERHGSFEAYRKAKEKLFEQCRKTHVLNLNDKHVKHFLKYPAEQKWGVTLDKKLPESLCVETPAYRTGGHCDAFLQNAYLLEGTSISPNKLKIGEWKIINGQKEIVSESEINFTLPGKFNAINLLLSLASARATGIPFSNLMKNVSKLALPPGRMQELKNTGVPYRIFLDYAHEPLSLRAALEACREFLPKNKKLICLTGAQGGGRDKWKRKVLGRTAADLCDYVVVGNEDPYNEDPDEINKEVLQGVISNQNFKENKNCWSFTDRQEAIKKALSLAEAKDVVILCGKGGEKIMCVGDKKIPWDEEEVVRKALEFKI